MKLMKKLSVLLVAFALVFTMVPGAAFADDEPAGGETAQYVDGYYTTTVNSDKESYGYVTDDNGNITQYGFNYPKNNYDFPVTVVIKDGKIADVAYTNNVTDIVANTSSDINYLMWAMDGHNVTEASYNYLAAAGKNYEKYHVNPPMNGKGIREQVIENQGTEGVDTVTAATITSRAIINAVNQNLEKAAKGEKDDPEPTLPAPDTTKAVIPYDGVYFASDVDCIGADIDNEVAPMILYVKDGKITADMAVEQRPSSYPHIFAGTEAEALAAGEEGWLVPVDYDYGYRNSKGELVPGSLYHNVPIASLDKKINFVMFAKGSGNWFNRLITISSDNLTKIPYGDYEADDFSFEGGSGRAEITCEKVHVTKKGITFDVAFSSTKYTKLVVDGVEYAPVIKDNKAVFEAVPLNINGQTAITGTTVAMSSPTDIEYTVTVKFDAEDLKPIEKVYQDGFYTTTVSTNKATYGWKTAKDGSIQHGFSYPSKDYDLPVTIQIEGGKVVDVRYPMDPNDIMMNTSSDLNYLLWAMDGHNVTDYSYAYLADDGNYETYHLNPYPVMNGKGLRDQIVEANGTNDVDTVTSATITSRAIIDSVDQSLEKAEKGLKDDPEPTFPGPDTSEDVIPEDGSYTVEGSCVGASLDEELPVELTVKDGVMTAVVRIEQRQKTYPYIFAGTEKEALEAGEAGWLIPEDYDYGYKYPGSLYKDVPIKSLDKPLHFVMYASGSGNWFNRLITLDSSTLKETRESIVAKANKAAEEAAAFNEKDYSAESYKALKEAQEALSEVMAKEDATDEEIKAATKALNDAMEALKMDISKATIKLSAASYTYDGKAKKPAVKSVTVNGNTLKAGKDYKVSYASGRKNVGTYKVTVTGIGKYTGKAVKTFKIVKAGNTMTVKVKTAKVKYSKLKKAKQTIARKNVLTVSKAIGNVTYTKKSGNKKITIAKKTGKVTVKKGLKKGTYKIKVAVKASGNSNYKAKTLTKTFKVKVA